MHLKILPMGASIVYGLMSSDGNGFRLGLQDRLEANGTQTTMVGTQESGNMTDNHHEAYQGKTIEQYNNISYHSGAYGMGANVALVLIGTNDCWYVKNESIPSTEDDRFVNGVQAASRLSALLGSIRVRLPGALVLASELPRNTNDWCDKCIEGFNAQLPNVVQEAAAKGQQVRFVEMYDIVPADQIQEDGTHPTDYGYQLMAQQYYDAIANATQDLCMEGEVNTSALGNSSSPSSAGNVPVPASVTSDNTSQPSPSKSAADATTSYSRHVVWLLVPLAMWALGV